MAVSRCVRVSDHLSHRRRQVLASNNSLSAAFPEDEVVVANLSGQHDQHNEDSRGEQHDRNGWRNVDVTRCAEVALPRRRLVLVFAPRKARPWHPDAGVALATRGDADMRAAATYRKTHPGL